MNLEEARELVATMADEYPAAYQLAKVVSLAVRIELELLRKARIDLLSPEVDAGAEADLLFSSLVQTQSPLAMTFEPAVTEVLREHLAADQTLLEATWKMLDKFHQDAPPALRLEEEVTWLALAGGNNRDLIQKRLESVVVAMARDNRPGLAKWAIRALPAMPKMARDSDMARILSLVASAPEPAVSLSIPSSTGSGGVNEWLSQIISHNLPQISVGVRLLTQQSANVSPVSAPDSFQEFVLPANQTSVVVEFSYPPATGLGQENIIEAPQTNPVLLEVSWPAEPEPRVERIGLQSQETRQIEVGSEQLTIRTALGDVHTLRPRFDYDFYLHYNASDYDWAKHLPRMFEQDPEGQGLNLYLPVHDEQVSGRDPLEYEPQFRLSRKVGFVLNSQTVADDWKDMVALAHKRADFGRMSDWLIPIIKESFELDIPSFFITLNPIDFSLGAKNAYQQLLSRITGKPHAAKEETKVGPQETPAVATTPPADPQSKPLEVFVSYALQDQRLADELFKHVRVLEKQGLIKTWDDSEINPGIPWEKENEKRLNSAAIILLLLSSNYLYLSAHLKDEMKRVLDRHRKGQARVIPILVGPITVGQIPFSDIQFLPRNARPISSWANREEAYAEVMQDLRAAIDATLVERSRVEPEPDQAVTLPASIPFPPETGFVARKDGKGKDIVESLTEALKPGATARSAVVALIGPGGVGKTTVAAETARRLSEVFRQRIVWINAGVPRAFNLDTLLDEIATQLRYPTLRSLPPNRKEDEVFRLTWESRTLIILDNFETIDAKARSSCLRVLTSKARCSVLITSRERLPSPRNFLVGAMTGAEAVQYLDLLMKQLPSVASLPGFERNGVFNAAEANPMLMQWVVKQMLVADPARVLINLRRRTGEGAQRVYDSFFGNDYMTDDAEKTLLALSLFSPNASRAALDSVVGMNEASTPPDTASQAIDLAHADSARLSDSLQDLYRCGLISETDSTQRVGLEGLALELTRARLTKDKRSKAFQKRFVSYFAKPASSAKEAGSAATLAFEMERQNLIKAMELASSHSDWPSMISFLETEFTEFLISSGYLNEATFWCSSALTAARNSQNRPAEARALLKLVAIYAQRQEAFQRYAEEAIFILKELKDYKNLAAAFEQIASIEMQRGNWEQVANCVSGSVDAYRTLGDREAFVAVVEKFGSTLEATNRFDEAATFHERIDKSSLISGDREGHAFSLYHLGRVTHLAGRRKKAIELLHQSLNVYSELNVFLGVKDSYASKATDLLAKIEQEPTGSLATKAAPASKASPVVAKVKKSRTSPALQASVRPSVFNESPVKARAKSKTAKSARSKAPTKKGLTTKIARPKTRATKPAVSSAQKRTVTRSGSISRSSPGGRMGGSKTSRKGGRSKPAKTFTLKKR